jgi:hypothetical protein
MVKTNTFVVLLTACILVLNSGATYAASQKKRKDIEKDENLNRIFFAGAEAIGGPLGDGKDYIVKTGLTSGLRLTESSGFSANFIWTDFLSGGTKIENAPPGTSQSGLDVIYWSNSLKGYKFSVHYEYYPSIFGNKFYALVGPACQSERYRVKNIERVKGGQSSDRYPNFGYDATTVGIDVGFGVRNLDENVYMGIGILEIYRPLKRLSYKNVNERPTDLAGESFQSPDSIRYKILSMQFGMRF